MLAVQYRVTQKHAEQRHPSHPSEKVGVPELLLGEPRTEREATPYAPALPLPTWGALNPPLHPPPSPSAGLLGSSRKMGEEASGVTEGLRDPEQMLKICFLIEATSEMALPSERSRGDSQDWAAGARGPSLCLAAYRWARG